MANYELTQRLRDGLAPQPFCGQKLSPVSWAFSFCLSPLLALKTGCAEAAVQAPVLPLHIPDWTLIPITPELLQGRGCHDCQPFVRLFLLQGFQVAISKVRPWRTAERRGPRGP